VKLLASHEELHPVDLFLGANHIETSHFTQKHDLSSLT